MTFQASDNKERYFLDLLNDELNPIKLTYCQAWFIPRECSFWTSGLAYDTYSKRESWLKFFGHSSLLCARCQDR